MGPGIFPLVLAALLMLLGARRDHPRAGAPRRGEPIGVFAWRGMVFILPAPIVFGLTVRGLGFVGSVFITALFACFASFKMKPLPALALSAR